MQKKLMVLAVLLLLLPGISEAQPSWVLLTELPAPRADVASVVVDGQLCIMGGQDARGRVLDEMACFDPLVDRWETSLPPLRRARFNAAAAVLGGRIFVIGGRDRDGEVIDDVEIYDPVERRWESGASLKVKRQGAAAVVVDGRLYVMGGSDERDRVLSNIEAYDPQEREWNEDRSWKLEPSGRAAFAAVVVGGEVYTFGGFGPTPLGLIQRSTPGRAGVNLPSQTLFQARGSLSALVVRDSVFLIGGKGPGGRPPHQVFDEVLLFVPGRLPGLSDRWERAPRLTTGREGFGSGVVNGRLVVVGGRDERGEVLASVESFEAASTVGTETETPDMRGGFALEQNYPNPFSHQTEIRFTVPSGIESGVELTVFDLQGRLVATLARGYFSPGPHSVHWGGSHSDGTMVAAGVYLYRLKAGGHTASGIMSLLR